MPGACRQVMVEFCQPDMPVTLVGDDGIIKETTAEGLLPLFYEQRSINHVHSVEAAAENKNHFIGL